MIQGLSDDEKFEVIRPVDSTWAVDSYGIPILNPITPNMLDWRGIQAINYQNLNIHQNNTKYFVLNFRYDARLDSEFWNHPNKCIPKLQSSFATNAPDFSVSSYMPRPILMNQVYKSRWCGRLWQSCGICTFPTMLWDGPDTYDICFSSVQEGSIVVLSSVGCMNNPKIFFQGYEEMIRRIHPPLVIVYGKVLDGMYGKFISFPYASGFKAKAGNYQQLSLPIDCSPIFERRRCS